MKTYILSTILLVLYFSNGKSQNVCFHFDDSIIGTAQNRENAFDLFRGAGQPLAGWLSVNGSPSISNNLSNANYPSGQQSMMLGGCNPTFTEGTALNYPFKKNNSYKVSFKFRYYSFQAMNDSIEEFEVSLTDSLNHLNEGGCGTTATIPNNANQNTIFYRWKLKDTVWESNIVTFTSPKDYSQLRFKIGMLNSPAFAPFLLIDDVCIENLTPISPVLIGSCFDFNDSIIGTLNNKENAFDLFRGVGQPLEGWLSVNGSPGIFPVPPSTSNPSADQCMILATCGANNSEGAAFTYNFVAGKKYKVTFKYRYLTTTGSTSPISTVDVLLISGLVHNNQGGCGSASLVAIPSTAQSILALTNFSNTTWQTASLTTSTLTTAQQQIWWRPNTTVALNAAVYLLVDDVCIEEVAPPATCFDFNDSIIGALNNKENAIDLFRGAGKPLAGWLSVNGSPSIFPVPPSTSNPSADQCMLLATCGANNSEGAAFTHNFAAGKNYKVSFKYRYYTNTGSTTPISNINVILTNGLVHNNQGGCGSASLIAVPTASQAILSTTNFSNTTWQTANLTTGSLTSAYAQVWWRPNTTVALNSAVYLLIDDVCIEEVAPNSIIDLNIKSSTFALYPNPANESVTIVNSELDNMESIAIKVFDILGKEISVVQKDNKKEITIDTRGLAKGNYIVKIASESKMLQSMRLSIVR